MASGCSTAGSGSRGSAGSAPAPGTSAFVHAGATARSAIEAGLSRVTLHLVLGTILLWL